MVIKEVRFVMDSQSVQTGNEFYPSGATAHFFASQADALVESGQAVFTAPPAVSSPLPPDPEPTEAPDYQYWNVKNLRIAAKNSGISGVTKMRKADLISALEEIQ